MSSYFIAPYDCGGIELAIYGMHILVVKTGNLEQSQYKQENHHAVHLSLEQGWGMCLLG